MQGSIRYNLIFAAIMSVVCAVFVSWAAVSLKERQTRNAILDKYKNVLLAAGLATDDAMLTPEEIQSRFAPIEQTVVHLQTGEETDIEPLTFDQKKVTMALDSSEKAPRNRAGIQRIPHYALVYKLVEDGETSVIILPIEGIGLWSNMYGFLALDGDLKTVHGLTYYEHGETAGLGGEVSNPKWKALWIGRKAMDENLEPRITVIKGSAGPAAEDPYRVDGLSGATITSQAVTNMIHFWLGENGFRPYLRNLRHGC